MNDRTSAPAGPVDVEVLIIGAGITGIHQLYRLREAGFDVRLVEAGSGVGGTWFWNRYPQARFDSESYTYGYFFSAELLDEWQWSEHFAGQPETERYLNFAVDRFGLRDLITLDARVSTMRFDDEQNVWTVELANGEQIRARFVVAATGVLSAPYVPETPGRDRFTGAQHHTGEWPVDGVDLTGRRVAVIGTGASAVQLIPAIVDDVAELVVYQRTANWATPLNNGPITDEEQASLRSRHRELYETCRSTFAGFLHPDATRATFDDTDEERLNHYEELWSSPGFSKLFSNYTDLVTDPAANAAFCEFLAGKIRQIVNDPAVAELLIPTDHGYGMKRPPMENGYYESFNRPNVTLVDLRSTPIEELTEAGIRTTDGERPFDVIIWATGFDAVTGALTRMDIHASGTTLRDFWRDGPRTYLGAQSPGFPNLLFAGGPHATYGNVPRSTETQVEFLTGLLRHVRDAGHVRVEPEADAEERWTQHVYEGADQVLTADTAWYVGSNIPGKAKRFLLYIGGLPAYYDKVTDVATQGYDGFVFDRVPTPA